MSRIGKYPVPVPGGVTVDVKGQTVRAKGKLGELSFVVHDDVNVAMEDGKIRLSPRVETRQARMIWPTMRTRVNNLVLGVSEGYRQELEITGVGYRANLQGKELVLSLGYSHEIRYPVPEGIKIEVEKPTALAISGIDKQKVGQVAAEIIAYRPPEPYKGKGVKRKGQRILRKEGKKK